MQNDFIYTYDTDNRTALYDMLKNKDQPCNNISILFQAVKRISIHIPLIYYQRIRWSSNSTIGYNRAKLLFKKQLIKFWESKSIISLFSFGRKTMILMKSTCCNKMIILDPYRTSEECNDSRQYDKILKNAKNCGIWIDIINMSINKTIKPIDILAKCIYVCMSLQNIYKFDKDLKDLEDHPIDMIDQNIMLKLVHEQTIDCVINLSICLLQKKNNVKFNPNKYIFLFSDDI